MCACGDFTVFDFLYIPYGPCLGSHAGVSRWGHSLSTPAPEDDDLSATDWMSRGYLHIARYEISYELCEAELGGEHTGHWVVDQEFIYMNI